MTTVACLFVKGEYPYTPEYVTRLYEMVVRWIDRKFDFVVLTDEPDRDEFKDFDTMRVKRLPGFAYWTKLELFNPERGFGGRVLYLDLDTLIVAPLAPILDVDAPFAITADPERRRIPKLRDSHGRKIVRRFNSSVMVWDSGTATELYTEWKPKVSDELSGDQDWIAEALPTAYDMPRAWFPRISECVIDGSQPDGHREASIVYGPSAKVILCKNPKNGIAAELYPEVNKIWRAAA